LVTSSKFHDLVLDDRLLIDPLARRGITAEAVVWDSDARWSSYDLVVLRTPWDYVARYDDFVAWLTSVPRLCNPSEMVLWNIDKTYLKDLESAGTPIIPSTFVGPGDDWSPPPAGDVVIKPTIGSGAKGAGRYDLHRPDHRQLAVEHVARLQQAGRTTIVQPYIADVDTSGETALVYLPDATGQLAFSHAIRKMGMLDGPDPGEDAPYRQQIITTTSPTDGERILADQVVGGLKTGSEPLLYARVDLVPSADRGPLLIELELTEPLLFFGRHTGAADRFADAIAVRLTG
jgi:hypothetical protein